MCRQICLFLTSVNLPIEIKLKLTYRFCFISWLFNLPLLCFVEKIPASSPADPALPPREAIQADLIQGRGLEATFHDGLREKPWEKRSQRGKNMEKPLDKALEKKNMGKKKKTMAAMAHCFFNPFLEEPVLGKEEDIGNLEEKVASWKARRPVDLPSSRVQTNLWV